MTKWIESQIETRAQLDSEALERAYTELAASVSGNRFAPRVTIDDVEQVDGAAKACLKYMGITPGPVPQDVEEVEDRVDWLCRPTGTMRRLVRLEKDWQTRAFGAMLGSLDTGEVIALLPRGVRGYYYLEPGTGRKVHVTREVAEHIDEKAILFYRPLPAKPLKVRDLLRFIFGVFDRNDYLLVVFAALVVTLVGLVPPWANQVAFNVVAPSGQARLILPIGALLLGVAVSMILITACRNLVMARVSTKLNVVTEAATFARVLSLPTSFFKNYSSGDLSSRVANITSLANLLASILLGSGLSALLSIVYIFQIGAFAPALALPALAIAVIQAVLTIVVTIATMRYEQATLEASSKLSGLVTALLNGIQKIKLAGAEKRVFAKWLGLFAHGASLNYNPPLFLKLGKAMTLGISLLSTILLYFLAVKSGVEPSQYYAFTISYGMLMGAFTALMEMVQSASQLGPILEMAKPFLQTEPETARGGDIVHEIRGGIELSHVTFRYDKEGPAVLDDLSLKINPGEYVAVVGRTGCGKSTLVRLLLGFEKPEKGIISYDGRDMEGLDLPSLRRKIGTVTQDAGLFQGDIYSNIVITAPELKLEDAWEAAETAGIAEDIRSMPMGMHTMIAEGQGGISGGQRQRIMIARAIAPKPKLLIFDEATSALDNKTQKQVSEALDRMGCTRLVIAHRLSTIRHCDRILVLDGGRIREEGSYEELIAQNGLFAELVRRQRLDTGEA